MLGISRWTEQGGSYRTIQRFYNRVIPWGMVFWLFFAAYLYQESSEYLLVANESVVSKSGKKTYRLDRFFSSIFGKPIVSVAFFALSVVSVQERKSYPLLIEQVTRSAAEKATSQTKKINRHRKRPNHRKSKGSLVDRKGSKIKINARLNGRKSYSASNE